MAIWGAVAKAGAGMLKGGAKKIAANKLLGRGKKKPQKPQQGAEQEKGGALAIRPTTTLMPSGPTGIVPSAGGALATIGDSGGTGGGQTAEEIAVNISSKIIRVEKLLKGSSLIKKDIREDARIAREKASDKAQEKALEKSKDPSAKKGPKLNLPGKGLLAKIFGFFGAVILGRIAMFVMDWLPVITPWLKKLGAFVDGVIEWSGKILNGLTVFIDWAYNLYDKAAGWVKNQFGDEAHEKFTTFMGNLKELIKAFLVWKIIGERIFKAVISSVKNIISRVFKAVRTIWVKLRRLVGRHVRKFFGNLAKRAGGALKAAGQGVWNVAKGIGSKVGGLFSKGGAKLAQTGAGKVVGKVGGFAAKIFGKAASVIAPALKAAKPFATKFLKRIPIFGSLIVGIISLMSGEPLGQALFKTIGAGIGGALGTFIPIPVIGTMLGEILGAFVGDLLYYIIVKRDPGKAWELLKGAMSNLFKAGKAVFNFVTGGFGRFYEGIPKIKIPDFPKEPPGVMKRVPFAGRVWKGLKVAMKVMLGPIGLLMGKEIPNLLWMYNPANTGPLLVKSFFPPSGEESSGKSAPLEEKQEKKLLATNQKSGAQGVIDSISNRASYEDPTPTTVKVSPSGGSSVQSDTGKGSSPATVIPVAVGSGHDAYEPLDFFG